MEHARRRRAGRRTPLGRPGPAGTRRRPRGDATPGGWERPCPGAPSKRSAPRSGNSGTVERRRRRLVPAIPNRNHRRSGERKLSFISGALPAMTSAPVAPSRHVAGQIHHPVAVGAQRAGGRLRHPGSWSGSPRAVRSGLRRSRSRTLALSVFTSRTSPSAGSTNSIIPTVGSSRSRGSNTSMHSTEWRMATTPRAVPQTSGIGSEVGDDHYQASPGGHGSDVSAGPPRVVRVHCRRCEASSWCARGNRAGACVHCGVARSWSRRPEAALRRPDCHPG